MSMREIRQKSQEMSISPKEVKSMKTYYKNEEVVILDKSADLVFIEFVRTKKTKFVKEELIRFSY